VHGQVDLLNAQLPAKQGGSSSLQRQVPALGTTLTEATTAVTAEHGEPTALPGRLPVVQEAEHPAHPIP
jgi:hypothetical protein